MSEEIKVHRMLRVVDIIHNWELFKRGLIECEKYFRHGVPFDTYRQIIFDLVVKHDSAWVGVVMMGSVPVGFGVAHECTPLFSPHREFEASLIYHQPGNEEATRALQERFESFLNEQNVKAYYVTTRRYGGGVVSCFRSPKYGFQRDYTVFKKTLA